MAVYHTLEDHQALLEKKGYMTDAFKASYKMGYWLKEFREQYDQCLYRAAESNAVQKFPMVIYGSFNDALESIKFTLRYEYHPKKEVLSLKSMIATLGTASEPYRLRKSADLPDAQKVYDFLSKNATLNLQYDLYNTLQKGFHRDRNPENDYAELDRDGNPRPFKKQFRQMRIKI